MATTVKPKFYTLYNPAPKQGLEFKEPSMTDQSFKDECDMGKLVDRYNKTGFFYNPLTAHQNKPRQPIFEDFADVPTFQDAQEVIARSQAQFESLPAKLRDYFDNDPALMLAFVADPKNHDKCVELGIFPASSRGAGDKSPANATASVASDNSQASAGSALNNDKAS